MNKATIALFTGAFSLGCFALWIVLAIYESNSHSLAQHVGQLPGLTILLINCRHVIGLAPLPFIIYWIFLMFRKSLSPEGAMLYVAILTFFFMALFSFAAVTASLPMVPYMGSLLPR